MVYLIIFRLAIPVKAQKIPACLRQAGDNSEKKRYLRKNLCAKKAMGDSDLTVP
jgi:hypothetical protein